MMHTDSDLGASSAPLPLFDRPAPSHAGARRTERAAASRVQPAMRGLRAWILHAVTEAGPRGLTPKEAVAKWEAETGRRDRYSIPPRFPELHRSGLIETGSEERDGAQVWRSAT